MAIPKLTNSTKITKKEADTVIQKMHDVAKTKSHSMTKKPGDSKHPEDIVWSLLDAKSKVVFSGSFPMTTHTQGDGGKNVKSAVKVCNDAIDYLNELE
jgi:hypothetical protein